MEFGLLRIRAAKSALGRWCIARARLCGSQFESVVAFRDGFGVSQNQNGAFLRAFWIVHGLAYRLLFFTDGVNRNL